MVMTKDYSIQFLVVYQNSTFEIFSQALLSKFSKVGDPRPRSPTFPSGSGIWTPYTYVIPWTVFLSAV